MRQPHDAQLDALCRHSSSNSVTAGVTRSINARATSAFDCGGHDSTPAPVTRCTVLRSPPIMPVAGETSLATIQSQPFLSSLASALPIRSSVSAAKPMTRRGRFDLRCATVERISGFSVSSMVGGRPCFLILLPAYMQRPPIGDGGGKNGDVNGQRLFHRGQHLPAQLSTRTIVTPGGSGTLTGPLTSTTSAPAAAAAPAIAWPCLPEDRLAMNRTGSSGSLVGPDVTSTRRPANAPPRMHQRRRGSSNFQRLGHATEYRPRRVRPFRPHSGR